MQPITVATLLQWLLNNIKHVSHRNPLVRNLVLRSLWRDRQNFTSQMTCAQIPLCSTCRALYPHHPGFLILMHHMDIETHFPTSIMEIDDDIPMQKGNHSMEANRMNAWLSEGYQMQRKAKRMGWLYVWQYEPPPPEAIPIARPLTPQIPVIAHIQQELLLMTNGSGHPDGRFGACIAIICTDTYQYTLYQVVIPISLDHSYAGESYVAWMLPHFRTNVQSPDHAQWCCRGQAYTDSMSYIQAL